MPRRPWSSGWGPGQRTTARKKSRWQMVQHLLVTSAKDQEKIENVEVRMQRTEESRAHSRIFFSGRWSRLVQEQTSLPQFFPKTGHMSPLFALRRIPMVSTNPSLLGVILCSWINMYSWTILSLFLPDNCNLKLQKWGLLDYCRKVLHTSTITNFHTHTYDKRDACSRCLCKWTKVQSQIQNW